MESAVQMAGRPRTRPEGEQTLTIRLPIKTHRTLKLLVTAKGLSLNDVVAKLIDGWVEGQADHEQFQKMAESAIAQETKK